MHTLLVQTDEHGVVIINHNADFSGDVHVAWTDGYTKKNKEVWLPGALLLAISKEAAQENIKSELISFIENL